MIRVRTYRPQTRR